MNDFNRHNKVTGIHWLKKQVDIIEIKVKITHQDGILSLPKYEDYATRSNNVDLQQLENKIEEFIFKWQEKVFSPWELQRYTDVHNCITDTELTYHDMIKNLDCEPSKVFTYIHEDYHLPVPLQKIKNTNASKFNIQNLNCLESLQANDRFGRILGEDTSSMGHLFRSEENITTEEEQWKAMHIVFDNSEYNEDSHLLLKQEAILVSLYHNTAQNYLLISPDVNNLELNPYMVETKTGVQWGYQYAVDVGFGEIDSGDELMTLLRKLIKKWEKKQKQMLNFVMPPLGQTQYNISLEILTAVEFDMDDLYIEYQVKIPEGVNCNDSLHGRTHISKALRGEDIQEWHFGHLIELSLEVASRTEPPPIQIFFEVISTDWWGRHRTEGYTFLPLAFSPGRYSRQLSCSRPEELNGVEAESRRFFVGGCHLIKDLEVLAKPQMKDANFKYTTTGCINLRWNTISQTHLPGTSRAPEQPGTSSASAILLGAEAVLRKYRKARARLAAATKDITEGKNPGLGDGGIVKIHN